MKSKDIDNHILKIVSKIKKHKETIAKERDKLREVNDELVDLLDSFDRGDENLEMAMRYLEDGCDALSEVV